MITRTAPGWHTEDWQIELSGAIRTVEALWQALDLPLESMPTALAAHREFPVRVPRPFLARIEKGNPDDPLLRQILPTGLETQASAGFVADPLGEAQARRSSGLLHKYQSRVLLVLSGTCAVNCRYCFRRHFPYEDNRLGSEEFAHIDTYLREHPDVNEVILSGGDPLVISNARLAQLLDVIEAVPHIRRVRIHSRLPVVIPQRVDQGLLQRIGNSRLQWVVVTHSNHPQELGSDFDRAMHLLQRQGVTLLNQAVLLRGVNDSVAVQVALSERLFAAGVLPYYLHLLDPVAGAHHFDVPEAEARPLLQALNAALPGFLVPRLVREVAGRPGKTPIDLHLA